MKNLISKIDSQKVKIVYFFCLVFVGCSNEKIDPSIESATVSEAKIDSKVPDILIEYLIEGKQFYFEEQKIYDITRKNFIVVYLCSYNSNLIKEFKKEAHFEMKSLDKERVKKSNIEKNPKSEETPIDPNLEQFWIEIGQKNLGNAEDNLVLTKVFDSKNSKKKPNYTYFDCYIDNDDQIGVGRLPAYNSNADVNCEFFIKYGWLGSWYYQLTTNLINEYQVFNFTPSNAYKVKVNVRHNWNNYYVF